MQLSERVKHMKQCNEQRYLFPGMVKLVNSWTLLHTLLRLDEFHLVEASIDPFILMTGQPAGIPWELRPLV